MTRHYTHTIDAAALDAVNGFTIHDRKAPKVLLSPSRVVSAAAVRMLVEQLAPKDAMKLRAEVLALEPQE